MAVARTPNYKRQREQIEQEDPAAAADIDRAEQIAHHINRRLKDDTWSFERSVLNDGGEVYHVLNSGNEYVIRPPNSMVRVHYLLVPDPPQNLVLLSDIEVIVLR